MAEDQDKEVSLLSRLPAVLPEGLKARAVRMIQRILGGHLTPFVESGLESWTTLEGRSRVDMIIAEEVGRRAINDPDIMERAKTRFLATLYREQENIEAVVSEAASALASVDQPKGEERRGPETSDDWISFFTRHAAQADTDTLRQHFGRLLAGEIASPCLYSIRCIRLLAELTESQANLVRLLAGNLFGSMAFQGKGWTSGELFRLKIELRTLGILYGQDIKLYLKLGKSGLAYLNGADYIVSVFGPRGRAYTITNVITLTELGIELMRLVGGRNERETAENLVPILRSFNPERITIARRGSWQDEILYEQSSS